MLGTPAPWELCRYLRILPENVKIINSEALYRLLKFFKNDKNNLEHLKQMSHSVSFDRTSINTSKMSYMAHLLIERYQLERRDRRIAGIIRLTKNHNRNSLDYLRDLGVRIRNRHTPSERVVTFRNTPISVLVNLRKVGLLGDVEQVYVGCFGKKRKRNNKGSRRGKR